MNSNELSERVNRIYAALEGVREEDLAKFPPTVVTDEGRVYIWQDFRGGATDSELANAAILLIHNVAHLPDHLKKWASRNGMNKSKVDSALQASRAFLILKDLSNNDKHGYPPRGGGHSGVSPHVAEFRRSLRLTTQPREGSSVGIILTTEGLKQVGDGTSQVIITGDVLDAGGSNVGDLHDLAVEAVEAVEALLRDFGISYSVGP